MLSIKTVLANAIGILQQTTTATPRLDAEVLLAYLLGKDRTWLYAHSDDSLPAIDRSAFERLIQGRADHQPVAYLIGERYFFGLPFFVSPHVLIPRPETELLVEYALAAAPPHALLVDVGTGSGCIAVSVAVNAPSATIIASDLSAAALIIARRNSIRHAVANQINLVQADGLTALTGLVDVLVSNPPYIPRAHIAGLQPDVKEFEPFLALNGGETGLQVIDALLVCTPMLLKPGGTLLMEIGADQGASVLALAHRRVPHARFTILPDLTGKDRILQGIF